MFFTVPIVIYTCPNNTTVFGSTGPREEETEGRSFRFISVQQHALITSVSPLYPVRPFEETRELLLGMNGQC